MPTDKQIEAALEAYWSEDHPAFTTNGERMSAALEAAARVAWESIKKARSAAPVLVWVNGTGHPTRHLNCVAGRWDERLGLWRNHWTAAILEPQPTCFQPFPAPPTSEDSET